MIEMQKMEDIYSGDIKGLHVFKPRIFRDDRGYFFETFRQTIINTYNIPGEFVQDNESKSNKGVLRGLHFQTGEFAQAKLVRVVKGAVWDVAVDLRKQSETYGQWYGVELNEENKLQFYVPRGFAHGFLVLEDNTIFQYKCDNYYNKDSEAGILWNSPELAIEWPLKDSEIQLSEKDLENPNFSIYNTKT